MTTFVPLHVTHSGMFSLPIPLAEAFPLFTAEGERRWVPGWDPVYLHPGHPSNEAGTVFRTSPGGDETIWLVLQHDPAAGAVEYARVAPGTRAGTVRVRCTALSAGVTQVQVTYDLTALTSAGNTILEALTPVAYQGMLQEWRTFIHRAFGLGLEPAAT